MKIILLVLLLIQQPSAVFVHYDAFNDFTQIKTGKLYVLDTPAERMQVTFWTTCKGNQTVNCEPSPFASIGLLTKDDLQFSKSLMALADNERFDLGEAVVLKTESQSVGQFHSLAVTVPAEAFQKFAKAKKLRMQLGGVIEFSFDAEQMAAIKELARHLP